MKARELAHQEPGNEVQIGRVGRDDQQDREWPAAGMVRRARESGPLESFEADSDEGVQKR